MLGLIGSALKGSKLITGAAVAAGGVAAVDATRNESKGWFGNLVEDFNLAMGEGQARAAASIKFTGIYAFIEQVGEFLMNISNGKLGSGIVGWARKAQGIGPADAAADSGSPASSTPNAPSTPAVTATGNALTQENEINLSNLTKGMDGALSVGNIYNKASITSAGAIDGLVNTAAKGAGLVADAADWSVGSIKEVFGFESGHRDRHFARDMGNYADKHLNFDPELKTAWDRVAYSGGQVAGVLVIPGAGAGALGAGAAVKTATTLAASAVSLAPTPDTP